MKITIEISRQHLWILNNWASVSRTLTASKEIAEAVTNVPEIHTYLGEEIFEKLLAKSTDFCFMTHTIKVMLGLRSPEISENIFFKPSKINRNISSQNYV